jgi:outer membrane protein OmpA-like peptidoglycan-associated protein
MFSLKKIIKFLQIRYFTNPFTIYSFSKYKTMKNILILSFFLSLPTLSWSQDFKEKTVWTFDLYFDFGKANIRPEYFPRLDSLAIGMTKDTGFYTFIKAHTDAVGSDKSNAILAQKRYESIRSYLMSKNVSAYHLDTEGFGEKNPVADNETDEGRQRNRRVEVLVKRRVWRKNNSVVTTEKQDVPNVSNPVASPLPKLPKPKNAPKYSSEVEIKPIEQPSKTVNVSGIVQDSAGKIIEKANVILRGRNFQDSTLTDKNGTYKIAVPESINGRLEVIVKDYFVESRILEIKKTNIELPIFNLSKVGVGASIKIKDLFFYKNTAKLFETSLPELYNIYQFMVLNNTYEIEIQGHVDYPGIPVPEQHPMHTLSISRANAVLNYLTERGIDRKRMTAKGFANWEMIYPNPKREEENIANRRVIIKIVKSN